MKKQKQRTHKSAQKRFKVTGSGKLLHRSHNIRHLKASKSKSANRRLNRMKIVTGAFEKKLKKLLGIA